MISMSTHDSVRRKSASYLLPVSLLTLTTAALTVPIFLVRRYRTNALAHTLSNSSPPRRRATGTTTPFLSVRQSPMTSDTPKHAPGNRSTTDRLSSDFNPALYAAKALGIATLLVGTGTAITLWGMKEVFGIRNVNDFGDAMRHAIRTKLPNFALRVHRDTVLESDSRSEWSLREAEARLQSAFEKDGFWKWVQAVVDEADAEAQARSHSKERGDKPESIR